MFVSPAIGNAVSGGPSGSDPGVRICVKIPNADWWKSEFIVYDKKIAYRGNGGDQTPRVAGAVGREGLLELHKRNWRNKIITTYYHRIQL